MTLLCGCQSAKSIIALQGYSNAEYTLGNELHILLLGTFGRPDVETLPLFHFLPNQ
jgi:hypothetical protein